MCIYFNFYRMNGIHSSVFWNGWKLFLLISIRYLWRSSVKRGQFYTTFSLATLLCWTVDYLWVNLGSLRQIYGIFNDTNYTILAVGSEKATQLMNQAIWKNETRKIWISFLPVFVKTKTNHLRFQSWKHKIKYPFFPLLFFYNNFHHLAFVLSDFGKENGNMVVVVPTACSLEKWFIVHIFS